MMGKRGVSQRKKERMGEGVKYRKQRKKSSSVSLTCVTVVQAAPGAFVWDPLSPRRAPSRRGLWGEKKSAEAVAGIGNRDGSRHHRVVTASCCSLCATLTGDS